MGIKKFPSGVISKSVGISLVRPPFTHFAHIQLPPGENFEKKTSSAHKLVIVIVSIVRITLLSSPPNIPVIHNSPALLVTNFLIAAKHACESGLITPKL